MTTVYWQDAETGSLMAAPKDNVLLPKGTNLLTKEE